MRGHGTSRLAIGRGLRSLMALVFTAIIVCIGWLVFLRVWGVSSLVGKTPIDVWHYLVTSGNAGADRNSMAGALAVTMHDAGLGFVSGIVLGSLVATSFVVWRPVEQALMPVSLVVRAAPLVALTPLIVLVVGRGTLAITIISGMIVFFPVLINVAYGLRSASREAQDLVRAFGGSRYMFMRKVAVPSALPAFFTSVRISVPGALIGGLIAEWEATGRGLGFRMENDVTTFQYTDLWACVVVITTVSLLLYAFVGLLEAAVLSRFGADVPRGRRN